MKGEFYNTEFPRTVDDFVFLARPFREEEIQLADKETLCLLAVWLKKQELKYYILYHELLNKVEKEELDRMREENRNP